MRFSLKGKLSLCRNNKNIFLFLQLLARKDESYENEKEQFPRYSFEFQQK